MSDQEDLCPPGVHSIFDFCPGRAWCQGEDEDPRCPGCGEDKNEGSHGLGNEYGGCV